MKLPLRLRITAWYFTVLIAAFASFAWISDYGFRHSIETTVNDSSRANLESIQTVLRRTAPKGTQEVKRELNELAGLWAGAGVLEVTDANGNLFYQSPGFLRPYQVIPWTESRDLTYFTANLNHVQYRIVMQATKINGQIYHVRAGVPTEPFDQALDRFRIILKRTIPILIVMASLLGYWLSGRALSPVKEIIQDARRIDAHHLSARVKVPEANDELRSLSETLNEMLARIEQAVRRITQFTADASHDLRTPVALIRANAELALRRPRSEEEYREILARILVTAEETTRLIENLLTLARADAGANDLHFERVDLAHSLKKAADETAILAVGKTIQVKNDLPVSPVWITADPRSIDRLLMIVFENAVKYTPNGGEIGIRYHNGHGQATVEIHDTGIGIAAKDLPHIFERFYRADATRSCEPVGSGLGLAIARWIVEMHHGSIEAENLLTGGAQFRITLPLQKASDISHS